MAFQTSVTFEYPNRPPETVTGRQTSKLASTAAAAGRPAGPSMSTLFDDLDWQSEWVGMPEFAQEKKSEYAKITVRFRNAEDLADFARLIGQKLNRNSQCTWHPELPPVGSGPKLRWVDESKASGLHCVEGPMENATDKPRT